ETTSVWPAYWLVFKATCVQAPEFKQTFSTVASVAPDVFRSCIWIWSKEIESGQCGSYQNVNRELPLGIATVCVRMLLPLNGEDEPSRAAYEPLWCALLTTCGSTTPLG